MGVEVVQALIAVLFLWAIMYVLVVLAARLIYTEAKERGQNAELWVLMNVVTGITGLLVILSSLSFRDINAIWLLTILGSLLVVLGPITYLVLPGRAVGDGGEEGA